MKVILKENVASLGYKDDVVEVKDGYGRNYLIPQGLAIVASKAALKQLAENQRQRAHKIAKILEDAQAAAAALEGVKVTITAKTSASGTIFGSVGAAQVSEVLAKLRSRDRPQDHQPQGYYQDSRCSHSYSQIPQRGGAAHRG